MSKWESEWESIGPRNITCVIRTLASHPSNQDILYAGAEFGGVWKTTDGGRNWSPTMDDELNLNVRALGICRNQPEVIYAAMSPGVRGGLVYRSLNGALTWVTMTDVDSSETHAIAVHPSERDAVYIAGNRSLHRSTSGGTLWPINDVIVDGRPQVNRFGIFDGHIYDVKIDPRNPKTVYISVKDRGLFKTEDGGNTWSSKGSSNTFDVVDYNGKIIKNIGFASGYRILLAIGEDNRPGRNGTQFIAAKVQGTILVSRNGGDSWSALPGEQHGYDSQNDWCSCLAICPTDQDFIVVGGNTMDFTLNASDDNPEWKSLPNSLHEDQQDISFTLSNPDNFYFANDGFIGKSILRGAKVSKVSDGLVAGQCFNVAVSQTDEFVVGCSTYHTGIIRTGKAVSPIWDNIGCCEGGLFEIDPLDEEIMFIDPWGNNTLLRSRTGGEPWEKLSVDKESLTPFYVTVIGIHPRDTKKIFACSFFGRLHWSADGGNTWDLVKNADKTPLIIDSRGTDKDDNGTCFAFDPISGDDLYLGTRHGHLWHTSDCSTNASGWHELNTPYPSGTGRRIGTISLDPSVPDTIYVGYTPTEGIGWSASESAIWRGTLNGVGIVSWTDISGAYISTSLPKFPVNGIIVDQEDLRIAPKIYAATNVGVFMTKNGGISWEKFSDGLPNAMIVDMKLRLVDRKLIVSAWGRGIYTKLLRPLLSFPDRRKGFEWYLELPPIERRYISINDPLYLRLVEHIDDLEQRLAAQGNTSVLSGERPDLFNGTLEKAQMEIRAKQKQELDKQLREQQKKEFREQQKKEFREQQKKEFREQQKKEFREQQKKEFREQQTLNKQS